MLSSRCSQVSTVLFLLIALGFGVFMGQASSKLKAAKAANAKVGSLAGRQAVVFGGTAGIGQGLAERLAAGGADVTIVGRNEEAGAKIVSTMQEANPAGRYAFLKADLMLLRNCKQTVETLQKSVTRLDYIVLCQTKATTQGLTKTEEGVDEKLGLHYFTRVFLGELLAPLMEQTASTHNADVRVMSVLSAGVHAVYPHLATDPFLEEHYSLKNAADAAGVYNDLWIQQAAHDHPSITYVHAAPGFVASNWGTDLPTAMRCGVRVMQATPFAKSIGDCAELLVQGLISPERRGGFVLLNEFGDDAKPTAAQTQGNVDLLHQQTQRVLQPFF